MSRLRCICVGGKSPVESSPAAAPPPFVRISPTHLLYHVERQREHSRRYIKWTDDLIPSKKTCLSFINRCSNFMFLLRDRSLGSDPHDCHDCSVLHCKAAKQNAHKTQIRLILSSTMICLLITSYWRGHSPPIPPLTLCCSSIQHIWTLHCRASWSYKQLMSVWICLRPAYATVPQTAITASRILQRQVHDTKKKSMWA